MTVVNKTDTMFLLNALNLQVSHLAVGTYPCFVKQACHPVNILFMVTENRDGQSYIHDHATGRRYGFARDCMYFRPCFQRSEVYMTEGVEFISIHFSMDVCYGTDIFQHASIAELPAAELIPRVRALLDGGGGLESASELKGILYGFAGQMLGSVAPEHQSIRWEPYRDVLTYARSHCSAGVTVETLAEIMHMRRESFSRRFKRDTGVSPKEFLTRVLLRKASQLLMKPGIAVRKVAADLEFSDEFYFSRFFKKHTGLSPSQYKAQIHLERM